jgi:dTDP-4-dehydrorhamnose 3,5-epimerase-like enzyme
MKENVILRGLTVSGPIKEQVNEWWDVVNGKNIEASKNCLGKSIVRERLTHRNKDQLLIMRGMSRMVNKIERDIRDLIKVERLFNEQKALRRKEIDDDLNFNPLTDPKVNVNIPNKKSKKDKIKALPSTLSVFRNSLTYQTHNMVSDIGYGMAGLIEWYSLFHRLEISLDAKNITNDYAEEHFGSMKFFCKGDLGQERIIATEARGAQFRIIEGNAFVARGFLHKIKNKRNKYLASKIYINGNCEANNDNGENEIETKYINRTHSVRRNDMNNLKNLTASNNAMLYKDITLFEKKNN